MDYPIRLSWGRCDVCRRDGWRTQIWNASRNNGRVALQLACPECGGVDPLDYDDSHASLARREQAEIAQSRVVIINRLLTLACA